MRKYYIEKLLTFDNCYLDYPFTDTNWAAIRHKDNNKIFALIYDRNGNVCINFKNSPQWAIFWRESFESVTPAYHMNKEHWSTVICGSDANEDQILQMIYDSYNLTKPKRKNNEQKTEKRH